MIGKVGFACKYLHDDQNLKPKVLKEIQQPLNFRGTTIRWLRENNDNALEKVYELIEHNLNATENLVDYVSSLPMNQRMVRLGSDMLPAYTEPNFGHLSKTNYITSKIVDKLNTIGIKARNNQVRLSMHPGQFCVLASDREEVVKKSIEEFEYHVNIARWLGYGKSFQDFKINVHISGRQGPEGIKNVLGKLSPEARNTITIENEENAWGLDSCLELEKHVPLVLDIHHHWCNSKGEYISANDDRVKRVIDSWRGVRPTCHYSVSREEHLPEHRTDIKPDFTSLCEQGLNKQKLRAHSDYMWNTAVNEWAGTFRENFDIMVESKMKNLASIPFEEETR